MIENNRMRGDPPDTLTDSIGSPESRAAARALLQLDDGPPGLIIAFPGREPKTATIGDLTFTRGDNESAEQFEARVADELPVIGPPKLIIMWDK